MLYRIFYKYNIGVGGWEVDNRVIFNKVQCEYIYLVMPIYSLNFIIYS